MNFDIKKFEENLKQISDSTRTQSSQDLSGAVNVIRYVWNHYEIEEIDFDSFSIDDVNFARESMENIELTSIEDSDEEFIVDPFNPFSIYHNVEEFIYALCHVENKHYESEDEEIFI